MVLKEENYKEQMNDVVLPYNNERKTESYVEREAGKALHLTAYRSDRAKASVVISHGYTESIVKYQEVIYYFLNHGYNVFMAEHCGHGKSYRLTEDKSLVHIDDYDRYVKDLLFIAHLCKEQYPDLSMYLFAHSMGGGIGAAAISYEPKLFDKVVLTSPMIRPATGSIPWRVTKMVARTANITGHSSEYVMGQTSYDERNDSFEDSCALSKSRYEYYKELRDQDETLQTCACSYAWAEGAVKLNKYLRSKGWRKVQSPVLLFQATLEELVSKPEQDRYIAKMARAGKKAALVRVAGSKHEIFNATEEIQEKYWKKIFRFFDGTEK